MIENTRLSIMPTGHDASQLAYLGSVVDAIAANLPEQLANKRFNAADFPYGFELGTPLDKNSLGDAIFVNGICYATSTDQQSADYYKTISGTEFMSSGVFIIPHTAKPSHQVSFTNNTQFISLLDCYQQLYDKIQQPLAIVGIVDFADFHATAIGKPPIDKRNIFDNHQEYYPRPAIKTQNKHAFIMGAVTDYQNKKFARVNQQLEVVLYKNPFDTENQLTHHAHVLTLKHSVKNIEDINQSVADQALHAFAEGTLIRAIRADIYTVKELINFYP